ncbi:MAG: insulinase family protein [Alphaproteobacteria bacterium]|nr:insulinase family protein [Alphaproteobacteria bacterium]
MVKVLRPFFCFLVFLGISCTKADILPIHALKTPSGLEVWLVEDHTSSVVSLVFTFEKSKFDSPFTSSALLLKNTFYNGAGIFTPLEMDRFVRETPSLRSVEIGVSKTILKVKTTKEGLSDSLKTWSQLISAPQFDKANLVHDKAQALASASHLKEDLEATAYLNLLKVIFPQATFSGDFESISTLIETLTPKDLDKENALQFLTAKPQIVVVGDVKKSELIQLLDSTFGALPLQPLDSTPVTFKPQWVGKEVFIEKDVPQSVIAFGQPGVHPLSKEYPLYLLLQNVLNIRFFEELRVKRGFIYSIQFQQNHYRNTDLLTGSFSCECLKAEKVVKFIRSEWERIKDFGITQEELSHAKLSFKKSHILDLTSTSAVASVYADFQAFNLGTDAAQTLLEKTEKVTLEEINEFVLKVLKPDLLTFVFVGPSSERPHVKEQK